MALPNSFVSYSQCQRAVLVSPGVRAVAYCHFAPVGRVLIEGIIPNNCVKTKAIIHFSVDNFQKVVDNFVVKEQIQNILQSAYYNNVTVLL